MPVSIDISKRRGVEVISGINRDHLCRRKSTPAVPRENLETVSAPVLRYQIHFPILIHIKKPNLRLVKTKRPVGNQTHRFRGYELPITASDEHVYVFIRHVPISLGTVENTVRVHVAKRDRDRKS